MEMWNRRRPLSRRAKLCRNLLVGAALLLLFWGLKQYPLPTMDMEFRRLERSCLVEPTQIVLRTGRLTGSHSHEPGAPLPKVTQEQILGLGEDYAVAFWRHPFAPGANQLVCWSFEEQEGQVKLAPSSASSATPGGRTGRSGSPVWAVAALQLPQGTARGEMTVEAEEGIYQEESQVLEHDLCLFAFQSRLSSYSGRLGAGPALHPAVL